MGVTFGPGVTISGSGGISINLKLQSPNISTATVVSTTSTSVSFNMPVTIGHPPTRSYTVTSHPGCITATGTSSPIVVSGLTSGQSYTFTVVANNAMDTSFASAASPSVTQISVPGGTYDRYGNFNRCNNCNCGIYSTSIKWWCNYYKL